MNIHISVAKNVIYSSKPLDMFFVMFFHPAVRSCFLPLGMGSGHLPDRAISASTSYGANYVPQFGRLNKIPASGKAGAWCAKSNDGNQWLQVFLRAGNYSDRIGYPREVRCGPMGDELQFDTQRGWCSLGLVQTF